MLKPSGNITIGHSWQSPCQDLIVLNRLKIISEEVLIECQCGFRAGRSTADMIVTLRQLLEKAAEQHQPLYVVVVDRSQRHLAPSPPTGLNKLVAAYFPLYGAGSLKTLTGHGQMFFETYGCNGKLINIIKQFHYGMKAQVSVGGEPSNAFAVNHGVKQGCILAPTLFFLNLTAVLDTMNKGLKKGVFFRIRTDGKLFNLAQASLCLNRQGLCNKEGGNYTANKRSN